MWCYLKHAHKNVKLNERLNFICLSMNILKKSVSWAYRQQFEMVDVGSVFLSVYERERTVCMAKEKS